MFSFAFAFVFTIPGDKRKHDLPECHGKLSNSSLDHYLCSLSHARKVVAAMVWQVTVVNEVHVAIYANKDILQKQTNSGHW